MRVEYARLSSVFAFLASWKTVNWHGKGMEFYYLWEPCKCGAYGACYMY